MSEVEYNEKKLKNKSGGGYFIQEDKTLEQLDFLLNYEKVTKEFTAAEYVKKLNDNIYTIVLFSDGDVLAEKEERGTGFPMEVNQELYKAITFEMKKRGWWGLLK